MLSGNWNAGKSDDTGTEMIKHRTMYDISVLLGGESIDYPGDTPVSRGLIWAIEEGGICDLSRVQISCPLRHPYRYARPLCRPGIPVILCTGHSSRIDEEKAKALGINGFVTKPVVLRDIARVTRGVLDEAKS